MRLPQTNCGDTLAVHNVGIPQKFIRWWTSSIIDHTACCIGNDEVIDVHPRAGVAKHSVDMWKDVPWVVLRPKVILTNEELSKGRVWLESQLGKKYDWRCIWGFPLLRPEMNNIDRWICSEINRVWYSVMDLSIVERTPLGLTSPQAVFASTEFVIADHNLDDPDLLAFIAEPAIRQLRNAINHSFTYRP
jgi:hypothetical protein